MKLITIVTATYNRGNLLSNVYASLLKQKKQNFEWLIVDDGSNDNTKEIVKKMQGENKIDIIYVQKENGGKHTALNIAFKEIKTELLITLDSDDTLTEDATLEIEKYHLKYKDRTDICGFCFLKGYSLDKSVTKYPDNEIVANYNEYIINTGIKGDKCEVFYSKILKKYSFEEYKGERFLAEGYLWSNIADSYDTVFINKVIYLCEYLEGGLTKSGRKMRLDNPKGGIRHAKEYLKSKYKFKIRFKNALLYVVYSNKAKTKIEFNKFKILLLAYLPGLMLYHYWDKKYCR